jgi:hypothetical protein
MKRKYSEDSLPGPNIIMDFTAGKIKNEFKPKPILYDMEININSILGFIQGWDIKYYTNEGKQKYKLACQVPTLVYSIIGNKNRGKSFILSKIANKILPNGYSVTTKGLSLAFPSYDNGIALLDSVGFESPLIESDGEEYRLVTEDKKESDKIYKKLFDIKNDLKNMRENRADIRNIMIKESELFKERNDLREKIQDIDTQIYYLTNERKITDYFLQRFIIENANIILLVVGKLSIDDQFFLNKLTKLLKENREQFLQKIIVIHNLMTMKSIKTVQDYIENTLKRSLTFNLQPRSDLKLEGERAKIPYNKYCYYEIDKNSENENSRDNTDDERDIIHVIMAQDGSEAGNYYNESAIDYIRKTGNNNLNAKEFDIIDKLKKYFCNVSETIFKFNNPKETIEIKDIEFIESQEGDKLKLNYKKELKLDMFYGDIINDTFGDPKFTPLYHLVSTDPKYMKIYLDCPGDTEIHSINVDYSNETTIVKIKGKRNKQLNKTMGRKFSSGEFELKIHLKGKDGDIYNEENKRKFEDLGNGFFMIKFERIEK